MTFRVRRSWGEMYRPSGHARIHQSHRLSLAVCPHYCTDPDVTWGIMVGVSPTCALLSRFRCTGFVKNIARTRNVSECLYSRSMPTYRYLRYLSKTTCNCERELAHRTWKMWIPLLVKNTFPNFLTAQCRISRRKPLCKTPSRFIEPFRHNADLWRTLAGDSVIHWSRTAWFAIEIAMIAAQYRRQWTRMTRALTPDSEKDLYYNFPYIIILPSVCTH